MRAAAALLLLAAGAAPAAPCTSPLQGRPQWRIDGPDLQIVFIADPAPLQSGRHFALNFFVCAQAGAVLPERVQVDADMPAHRHGMNYAASVTPLGAGSYRAEGLMFHMPGRWRFIFDLTRNGQTTRLTREVEVP